MIVGQKLLYTHQSLKAPVFCIQLDHTYSFISPRDRVVTTALSASVKNAHLSWLSLSVKQHDSRREEWSHENQRVQVTGWPHIRTTDKAHHIDYSGMKINAHCSGPWSVLGLCWEQTSLGQVAVLFYSSNSVREEVSVWLTCFCLNMYL